MLWVVFFYSSLENASDVLIWFESFGYGGVDIFLFASAIGGYFSLEKDPDTLKFLSRRAKRLVSVYMYFIIPWLF